MRIYAFIVAMLTVGNAFAFTVTSVGHRAPSLTKVRVWVNVLSCVLDRLLSIP